MSKTPQQIVEEAFPFDVHPEHEGQYFYHRLLIRHGRYMALGTASEADCKELRILYSTLRQEDLVITYDPKYGWGTSPRLPEDEDMLVRIPDMTEEQEIIWCFPPDDLTL